MTTQAESNIPHQQEKKGPLSKLFGFISLPKDQFKFSTPQNNEVAEQEQTDFSVLNPQLTNIGFPEFIHDQSYEDDVRENVQLNTYNKTHREEKLTLHSFGITQTWMIMELFGIIQIWRI